MWSRAVNLLICKNLDSESFINAFQIHIYDYGYPEKVLSDAGSSIVSSLNIIKTFLNSTDVNNYLKEKNIKTLSYLTCPPNSSYLGSIVESLVKQVKNMVYSSISKNVLSYDQFYLLLREINMLINKRPIAFQPLLNNENIDKSVPSIISPEILLKGYEVPSLIIAPHLHVSESVTDDPDWIPINEQSDQKRLVTIYKKYQKVKNKLHSLYHDEFLTNLRELSTNRPDKYKSKSHIKLAVDDIVSIKQEFSKPYFYPIGIVTNIRENDLGEVVEVSIKKSNGEIIQRHVTNLILLKKASAL